MAFFHNVPILSDESQTQPRSLSGICTDLFDYVYSIAQQSLPRLSNLDRLDTSNLSRPTFQLLRIPP